MLVIHYLWSVVRILKATDDTLSSHHFCLIWSYALKVLLEIIRDVWIRVSATQYVLKFEGYLWVLVLEVCPLFGYSLRRQSF